MARPRRVLFFCIDSDNYGGGSKMIVRLLRNIDNNLIEPVVLLQKKGALYDRLVDLEIESHVIPFEGVLRESGLLNRSIATIPAIGVRILQYNWKVRDLLRSVDIIWCQNIRAVLAITPSTKIVSAPVIWNIGLGRTSQGKYRYLYKIIFSVADHIFIESREQAHRIFGQDEVTNHKNKFVVFNKGIDTSVFNPEEAGKTSFPSTGIHIGTATSIIPRKGLEQFINAAKLVAEDHSDIQFHIAGKAVDQEYKEQLESMISSAGLTDQITFHGWVEDMPAYLNSLDVFVLTSKNEGIPGAVREALAMKTPVVATDVGGTSDAVLDGECGYLVEVHDEEDTADKISQLLDNEELRKSFGRVGREHMMNNFSIESYVRSYEEFLTSI